MTRARSTTILLLLASTLAVASPQQPMPGSVVPGQPTRTPPRATRPGEDPQKGTSILRGTVVAPDTGNPVRRALVNVRSTDGRGGGAASTDADGRFEVKDLPGGRYLITAAKAGFVTTQYGQRRPEQQGTFLEVIDGQLVEKIAITLLRGGVITGQVTDEFGDPVAGAQIGALRLRYMNGARRLMPGAVATTDDLGNFRIYGLAPGEYFVAGSVRTSMMMGMSASGTGTGNMEGFAQTFYPGTPNAGEAQRVAVKAGQESAGVSFALAATRLARISGRAVSSAGEPLVRHMIMATPSDRLMMGMGGGMSGGMTRPDGTFEISGVAPGVYNVAVRPQGMSHPNTEFGTVRVTVGHEGVDNLLIVTSRGAVARGVVVSDDGSPLPVRPEQVNIMARPVDFDVIMGGESKVNDDWTFEITGLAEPRILMAHLAESPDWSLKAVMHGGVDVSDTPIDFVPGKVVEGLEVVFTRKTTHLSGSLTTSRGTAETDATVIIFAEDRARWTSPSRFVRSSRPDQEGRYTVRGIPPADYFVIAVRSIEPGQWQDPDFLDSLTNQATRVSLGDGETRVQDLKVMQ